MSRPPHMPCSFKQFAAQSLRVLAMCGMAMFLATPVFAANSGGSITHEFLEDGDIFYSGVTTVTGVASGGSVSIDSAYAGPVTGGAAKTGDANNNVTRMTGGSATALFGGYSKRGNAVGNTVIMTGGKVGEVVGGQSDELYAENFHAKDNTILFSGGEAEGLYGGSAATGHATGNSIIMTGGTVRGYVTGGLSGETTANNSVTVRGGTVNGEITGGVSFANATGNTVTLLGSPNLREATINGGSNGRNAVSSGNTLNMHTFGLVARNINFSSVLKIPRNTFQHYSFVLPPAGIVGLTLTGEGAPTKTTDFANIGTIALAAPLGGTTLHPGYRGVLLQNANGLLNVPKAWTGQQERQQQGLVDFDLRIGVSRTELYADVTGTTARAESRALTEGRSAAQASLTMSADLAAGKGMESLRASTREPEAIAGLAPTAGLAGGSTAANRWGLAPFVAVHGGTLSTSGSHYDISGLGFMAGLGKSWSTRTVDVVLGAFFEAGWSTADGSTNGLYGKNRLSHTGGGFMARADLTGTAARGLYAETSFRAGSLRQDFRSDAVPGDALGRRAAYDKNSTYYGLHAGVGYVWTFSETMNLDLYGKYFWNRQAGFDVTLLDQPFSFDAINSHRVRTGGRLNFALTETLTPYVGATFEHEFGGKARGTVYQADLPSVSVAGSTAIGEIGLKITPGANCGFFVDMNAQGFAGKRRGVMGSLLMGYEF